ncbi:Acetyltransferase (GNAT) domain protein [compost metagenome]
MTFHIETPRLILRDIRIQDAEAMFEMDSNPLVHQYLGNKPVKMIGESLSNIAFIQKQYLDFGIGRWAVIEKTTGQFMGWAGLKWITEEINGYRNFYDLGYRLLPRFWAKGFATEAAKASFEYGFSELKLENLYAITHIENLTSKHILQKTGFSFIETFKYQDFHCNWLKAG